MRNFSNPDTNKIYRVVKEGSTWNSPKLWRIYYGPYTSFTKAKEMKSRHPGKVTRSGMWHQTWIEESTVEWKLSPVS